MQWFFYLYFNTQFVIKELYLWLFLTQIFDLITLGYALPLGIFIIKIKRLLTKMKVEIAMITLVAYLHSIKQTHPSSFSSCKPITNTGWMHIYKCSSNPIVYLNGNGRKISNFSLHAFTSVFSTKNAYLSSNYYFD